MLMILRDAAASPARRARAAASVALGLLLLVGGWYAKWPLYWGEQTRPDVVMRQRYMRDIYDSIRAAADGGNAKVFLAVTGYFTNTDAFAYMADKDDLHDLNFVSDFTNADLAAFQQMLDQSQFVLIGDPDNPDDNPNAPYTAILEHTLPMVVARKDFRLALVRQANSSGKNYYLFRRRDGGR